MAFIYVVALVGALGGMLFGYDTGAISGALLYLKQDFALNYFGSEKGPQEGAQLDQLQLAPTILKRLGVKAPATMKAKPFL